MCRRLSGVHGDEQRCRVGAERHVLAAPADDAGLTLEHALRVLRVLGENRDPPFDLATARFAARVTLERRLSPSASHRVLPLAGSFADAPGAIRGIRRAPVLQPLELE